MKEALSTKISLVRKTFKKPIIIVNWDLNPRDLSKTLCEVGDFAALPTGPTRCSSTIDVLYSNIQDYITESDTLLPLQAISGAMSNHRCVFAKATFPVQRRYEWTIKWRRSRNANSEAAFTEEMKLLEWSDLRGNITQMAERLETIIGELTDRHFPLVRVRKRSNGLMITKTIRRLWKRKVRLFKKGRRTDAWWETDWALQTRVEEARNSFVERLLEDEDEYRAGASMQPRDPSHLRSPRRSGR